MRYWDTSALLPLVVAEAQTRRMRSLLEEDPHIVTWAWTSVEFATAVERRARQGELTREQRRDALGRFAELAAVWDEVTDVLAVRRHHRSASSASMSGSSTPRNAKASARSLELTARPTGGPRGHPVLLNLAGPHAPPRCRARRR